MTLTETRPVPAEPVTRSTRDVLLAAARYIEEHGWLEESNCLWTAIGDVCEETGIGYGDTFYEAERAAAEVIGGTDEHRRAADIFEWNDRTGRTVTEVLAALRAAAETAS